VQMTSGPNSRRRCEVHPKKIQLTSSPYRLAVGSPFTSLVTLSNTMAGSFVTDGVATD
jgi:hypothetical protein